MSITPRYPLELRHNKDGTPDEIVCTEAFVHLEQMDNNSWWMVVEDEKTGKSVTVWFSAKGRINVRFEE